MGPKHTDVHKIPVRLEFVSVGIRITVSIGREKLVEKIFLHIEIFFAEYSIFHLFCREQI